MIDIVPLTRPTVDYAAYIEHVMSALGRTTLTSLDREGSPAHSIRSMIVAWTDLVCPGLKPGNALEIANEALNHLSFSFMVYGPSDLIIESFQKANLHVTIAKSDIPDKFAIVSGTLKEWQCAINSYLKVSRIIPNQESKIFYDKMVIYFERMGLSRLFKGKVTNQDGTFLLEK